MIHSQDLVTELPKEAKIYHQQVRLPTFSELEDLGAVLQPHCEDCVRKLSKCKDCSYRGQVLNRDQREVVRKVVDT